MHDARDAEDRRLIDAGEIRLVVESYYGVILDRCRGKVWQGDDAIDVAHEAVLRLLDELKRGRRYRVPFRVVVHQVTTWKIKDHWGQVGSDANLDDHLHQLSTESTEEIALLDDDFEAWITGLTELEQEVLRLRYVADLDFQDIARRVAKEPNAVHQIHFRALEKLRKDVP